MTDQAKEDEVFSSADLDLEVTAEPKRRTCNKCKRPVPVCWCQFLPETPIAINTQVVILQHKSEERRNLSTTPMLTLGLDSERFTILRGSRFNLSCNPFLKKIVECENTYLLYPDEDAVSVESLPSTQQYNLIALDGTWKQASGIYHKNVFLQGLKKVKVTAQGISKYSIRTQPTDECVSTLESVALALQSLEKSPHIFESLTRPLDALCEFQMNNGAVPHQSKEHLMKNGLHKSQRETERPQRVQEPDRNVPNLDPPDIITL